MKLKIAGDLSLPMAAVTEVLGFLGRRGQGKSYAAQKLAELFHEAGAQFVALDPVGIWYGLRLAANGKDKGIPIPVFGGLHGDVPLEPGAGKMIADVISDRGISAVLDVSHFESDADKARFATDFGARFYFRRKQAPAAVHLFLEECQEFVPQNPQREETRMLHVYQRMTKLGRNYGIGVSLISQRPQEVHKKVLNLTELLFAFQLTGPHERKAVALWIQEKGINEDIDAELPKLKIGAPHAWSPAWLNISRVVHIGQKWTLDASSTPTGKVATVRELAPIDLDKLRKDMAATIEKAKADDPRELRKELAAVRAELAAKNKTLNQIDGQTKVIDGLLDTKSAELAARLEKLDATIKKLKKLAAENIDRILGYLHKHATAEHDRWEAQSAKATSWLQQLRDIERDTHATMTPRVDRQVPVSSQGRRVAPVAATSRPASLVSASDVKLNRRAERQVLQVLATHGPRTKRQLAIQAGYAASGGGFLGALSKLKTAGLIHLNGAGTLAITDAGLAAIGDVEPLPTGAALVTYWLQQFNRLAEREVLRVVVDAYPDALTGEEIASRTNPPYESTGGGFLGAVSKLRTLGLIEGRGELRASDELFG